MTTKGLDALIVCGDAARSGDIRWLANWTPGTGSGFLLVTRNDDPVLVLHDEVPGFNLCRTWIEDVRPPTRGAQSLDRLSEQLVDLLMERDVRHGVGIVGATGLPTPVIMAMQREVPSLEIVDAAFLLSRLRAVKSDCEIAAIRAAVAASDAAMVAAIECVREGASERAVVGTILQALFEGGADGVSFMPLVVAGPRAAWKHATPTSRPIGLGEPVYIDLGGSVCGYSGDLSRTVLLGEPTRGQARRLEFALAANEAMRQAARPGITAGELRSVGDSVAERFRLSGEAHGTGHGIGCSLREEPLLDPDHQLPLEPGMVLAVEPMALGSLGTYVVEDDLLITEAGSEDLSQTVRSTWLRRGACGGI